MFKKIIFIISALMLCVSVANAQELPEEPFSLIEDPSDQILQPVQPSVQFFQDPYEEELMIWNKISIADYQPSKGDYFMADLKNSVGYLMNNQKKIFAEFPILSGRRRWVRYLRNSYFAGTPEQTWYAKEDNILGDRVTFSKSGRFLRLYENDGEKRTHYGIHGHKYFDVMIRRANKYVSFGCIIVDDSVLDVVEKSFHVNDDSLRVISTTDESQFSFLKEKRVLTFVN